MKGRMWWVTLTMVLGLSVTALGVSTPEGSYQFEDNFNDSSGNNNHAALTSGTVTFMDNSVTATRAGQWPSNVSAPPDVVTAPANVGSAATYSNNTHDLTVAFWVRPVQVAGHSNKQWICWKADQQNNRGWALMLNMSTTRPEFYYWDDRERYIAGDNLTVYNTWQHWTMVWHTDYGPGNGDIEWYYNGQLVDYESGTNDNLFDSPTIPLWIGSKGNSAEADEDLAGGLDSLQIWNEALSATDVWQVYKATLPPCATAVSPAAMPDPTVTAYVGQTGTPNPVQIEVRSMGQNTVNWSVSVVGGMPAWITGINPQNGQLTEPWPNASGKATVNVSIDASSLSPGVYTATLQFTDDCSPANVHERVITLHVDGCDFTVAPGNFESLPGAGCPGPQNHEITLTNTTPAGGPSLNYTVVEVDRSGAVADVPWLSVDKYTGGPVTAGGGTDIVTATVNYRYLEVGRNVAKLRFTSDCDPYEYHEVEILAPFILNYQGNVDPEANDAGGPGLKFTEKSGDSSDADLYRSTNPPGLVVVADPDAVDGWCLHIADGPDKKLKLRTQPSQNIGSNTGATIVGRMRTTFKFSTSGENLSIWHDGGGTMGIHWSGAGDVIHGIGGAPGYVKETSRGNDYTFVGQTTEWYAAYHTFRGCMGDVGGSRMVQIYFDEKPTPLIQIYPASNKTDSAEAIGFGTGSTAGQQAIYFDWVTGTNAGMFGPGKEKGCIGQSLCLGPDSACNPCHDPFADADDDGDVDQEDFALLQICMTGSGGPIPSDPEYCFCFDQRDSAGNQPVQNGNVDEFDAIAFENCASGPNVQANTACDDPE